MKVYPHLSLKHIILWLTKPVILLYFQKQKKRKKQILVSSLPDHLNYVGLIPSAYVGSLPIVGAVTFLSKICFVEFFWVNLNLDFVPCYFVACYLPLIKKKKRRKMAKFCFTFGIQFLGKSMKVKINNVKRKKKE